jgi:hypothetical protein
MNGQWLRHLEGRVARIIAPLIALDARKRSMREELLAHCCEVYQEELAQLKDETLAVEETVRRLGDADELTSRLQASLPLSETLICLRLARKELIMSRWFWMLLGLFLALFGVGMVLPALAKLKQSGSLPAASTPPLLFGVAIFVLGLCLFGYGIARLIRASLARRV